MKPFNSSIFFFTLLSYVSFSQKVMADVIINKYAAVLGYQPCNNALNVDSTTGFNIGDTVLMIQMKGATIDTTNTINFGNVLNYNNCGNYEYNVVNAINGNNISLKYAIVRSYDIPNGIVQLVKVPSFQNYTVSQAHTCVPWNGNKGGVFAIFVTNTLTLNANIDVSENGFIGATNQPYSLPIACTFTDFCMAPDSLAGSPKGEGIANISVSKSCGRGKLANGGGGGNGHNSGGAGGSNCSTGGNGGSEYEGCNNNSNNNVTGGIGGLQIPYSNTNNKIFLGGGGGSGQDNNNTLSVGGNGGAICIVSATTLIGNNNSILSNGKDGLACVNNGAYGQCHDGMGGGGGAGTILLNVGTITSNVNIQAKGGKGANENANASYFEVGPGGGGGGGVIWSSVATLPANVSTDISGGANGVVAYSGEAWGAQPGQAGQLLPNLSLSFPSNIYTSSNTIANFTDTQTSCFSFNFFDQSTAPMGTIVSQQWDFGDGTTSSQQNPTHTYAGYGSYNVTLTVYNTNGCDATVTKNVDILYTPFATAGDDTTACGNVSIQLHSSGGVSYNWVPASGLNDASLSNPIASPNTTTTYLVTVTDSFGCTDLDSVKITVEPYPNIILTPPNAKLCGGGSVQLNVTGINNPQWFPATGLTSTNTYNPIASPTETTTYTVTGTNSIGCSGKDSITVAVFPMPNVVATAAQDSINCADPYVQLQATGGVSYYWTPFAILNNPSIADPIANLNATTTFIVQGTDVNGCVGYDSVTVDYSQNKLFFVPNAFSPNGDGVNDIFLPKYLCGFLIQKFFIYNRYGQRVFSTTDLNTGWDGMQNGKKADVGTYFWYIEGKTITNQTIIKKGDLTLIR